MPKLTTTTPLKHLSILGSTGSIGRSALAVVDAHPDRLRVVGLAAGENAALLAEQTARYRPEIIATAAEATLGDVRAKLPNVPDKVVRALDALMAKAADDRPDSAAAALALLEGLPSMLIQRS